jgi:hypothetical protein
MGQSQGGQAVSDTLRTDTLLIIHDMDPEPKVLINHARALERALNNADARIKRLEEAGDAMADLLEEEMFMKLAVQWRKAKEAKL